MASVPQVSREELRAKPFICPKCPWQGKAYEALIQLNDVMRCPLCRTPTEWRTPPDLREVAMPMGQAPEYLIGAQVVVWTGPAVAADDDVRPDHEVQG